MEILLIIIFVVIIILSLSESKLIKKNIIKTDTIKKLSKKRDFYLHNRFIKKNIKDNSNILNFGCGLNTYSSLLRENNTVSCLDIEDNSLDTEPIILYDGTNIPNDLVNFDFVIISTVLHHIPSDNIKNILQNLKSRTKNILIIEDYIDDNWYSYLKACVMCGIFNFSFINRSYSFKPKNDWMDLFNELEPKEILYDTDFTYECYVLKF